MLAEASQVLLTIASVAATLAGFSSLAIAFGPKRGSLNLAQKLTVRVMIMVSLSAMLFALAPMPFLIAGVQPPILWNICLSLLAAHYLFFATVVPIDLRRRKLPVRWPIFMSFIVVHGIVGIVMLLGALNVGNLRGPGTFVAGLIWLLVIASAQLLFHIYQIHAKLDTVAVPRRSKSSGE